MKTQQLMLFATLLTSFSVRSWSAIGMASIEGTKEESDISGELKFEDTAQGLKISGTLENIPSGEHAFHIHEFGDCGDEGKNAGSHYNPDQHAHGLVTKDGASKVHPGDLGNITADEKGSATINLTIPGVSLTGTHFNVAGRAVVLHEKRDDFGQPVGNAGSRIGCGPIVLTGK